MAAVDARFIPHEAAYERRSASDVALSLVQVIIGYEWLVSGLSKIANGDFAHGMAAQLADFAKQSPPWYGHFLNSVIEPHALVFGYLIEYTEFAAGIVLVGIAFTELALGTRLTQKTSRRLQRVSIAALVAGIAMVANFELANGGTFGLHLAPDSFDEGVDLDTIMVAAQLALLVSLAPALRRRNR